MKRQLLALPAIILFATAAFAGGPRQKSSTLTINHYDGTVEYKIGSRADDGPLQETLVYDIDHDEQMHIVLKQTNPLLFTYTWKAGTPTNTLNFDQFSTWADAVKGVVDILKPFADTEHMQSGVGFKKQATTPASDESEASKILRENGVTPEFVNDFVANANKIIDITNRIPADIKKSGESWTNAQAVRDAIVKDDVPTLAKKLRDQLAVIDKASLAVMNAFVTSQTSSLGHAREEARVASLGPFRFATLASMADDIKPTPATKHGKTGGNNGDTTKKNDQTEKKTEGDGAKTNTRGDFIYQAFLSVRLNSDRIRDMLGAVEKYASVASKIGQDQDLATVSYNMQQDQPFTLTIDPVPDYAASSTKLPHGKYTITVGPSSPVDFKYGVGAVYSWVESKKFEAVTENGVTTITRKDAGNQVNGLTGAAMLSIVPRKWNDPIFGRGFQLGFVPVKDHFAILGGGELRFFDRMTVGGGIVYQQAQRLASDLEVGKTIPNADALKTTSVFKAGFYLALDINMR